MASYRHLAKLLRDAADYASDLALLDELGALDDGNYTRHLDGRLSALLRRIAIARGAEHVANDAAPVRALQPEAV